MTPACSVVIRAFNEQKHIGRLLSGILQQTVRDVEIILVDSGSTDATLAIASQFPVRVVAIRPDEFSFGRSLNRGCAAALGDRIVLASAHVYPVYPDWLEKLLVPFDDPAIALSFGKQRGNHTSRFSETQILAKWFPEASSVRGDDPFCNNANAAIRKSLWRQRAYDEDLPGLEDLDWAGWALAQGHRIAYVADAEVIHAHAESPRDVYNRYRREAMGLKRVHPNENFRLVDFVRLFSSNVASDLWHASHEGQLASRTWEIVWFRWMQFWGTLRGFALSGPLTGQLKQAFYYPRGFGRSRPPSRRPLPPIEYDRQAEAADKVVEERPGRRKP
jgi:rhamnosyltransferase